MMEGNIKNEATPLIIDLKTTILIRWDNAMNEISRFKYYRMTGADAYHSEVKRSIYNLFSSVRSAVKQELKPEQFSFIEKSFEQKNKCDECLEAFNIIDKWLYDCGLTKFNNRKAYDRQRAEVSNRVKGLG